ncbi:hypothetical protein N665_1890s0003 [Sinapis alba]|nr:hypothetical protein N665_1890s0003 [Sinapis alba]
MRKAILLSKRTSATPQNKGSTSTIKENPIVEYTKCGALVWTSESIRTNTRTGERRFTICCNQVQIKLPRMKQPPAVLEELLECRWFRDTIRIYNAVLAFTSIEAKLDYIVVYAPGPFTFRIQGQSHHRIGSLIPSQGQLPKYLQLYIFDTKKQVSNRLKAMGKNSTEGKLDETTVKRLIKMLDENNCLAKVFRLAHDYYETNSGEEFNIRLVQDKEKGKEYDLPSASEYYASQIQTRLNQGMTLIKGGLLLHQYAVDVYIAIEEDRLRWARNNQDVLRAVLYSNVLDAVTKGDTDAKLTGQRFILPPSFTGGPRQFGNPDLFITMTANPNWQEIKEHLATYDGDSPNDRPVIKCRVFKIKIEFQKRGLPHAHILLWFGNSSRTPSAEEVDKIISAELPKKEEDPEGYNLVSKHMIHVPCGVVKPNLPCIEKRYVLYRRRWDETTSVVKDGAVMNNTSVVPHNIDILKKYEAHINVEWCNRTSAVKYLFKYITKGVDKATAVLEKGNNTSTFEKGKEVVTKQRNEIQDFIECCYLSACESMWQIFAFHIHKRKPPMQKLIIHLEGEHNITVKETNDLGRVIRKPRIEKTMFTEWMVLCRRSEFAQTLTYVQIPEYFGVQIGRIVTVHPSSGDHYSLRILINKIKGPRSYDELKTCNVVKYPDYKSVFYARGYLDNDVLWHESISECSTWATPSQLRDMFVTFLINCFVSSPKDLWEHSWKSMSEEILYKRQSILGHKNLQVDDENLEQYTLIEVEKLMRMHERSLNDFGGIPKIKPVLLKELGNNLWNQELDYDVAEETLKHEIQYNQLNDEQRVVYNAVLESIEKKKGKLFFVNGAGGTGKTFLYQTLISRLRSRKQIVLPVTSSGIAALLLPNGRTTHSRFNIL